LFHALLDKSLDAVLQYANKCDIDSNISYDPDAFPNYKTHEVRHFCSENKLDNIGSSDDNSDKTEYVKRAFYVGLGFLSIVGLCTVAMSIFYNKKLGAHPSPLIARICLVEAIMCWNSLTRFLGPQYIVCYFNLYSLFHISTFERVPAGKSMLVLVWSNELIKDFSQLLSLALNIFLCIDLILTLWSPFDVARGRTKYYNTTSILVSLGFVLLIWF